MNLSQKIKLSNYIINYIEAGKGEPVLLIHGANIGLGEWYKNINFLSLHFKVFAIDLPGAGESTKINFYKKNLEELFVDTVIEFINIKKMKNVSLIGHSMGGWIAVKVALKSEKNIKKIILVDPVGFSNNLPLKFIPISIYPVAKLLLSSVLKPTKLNLKNFLSDAVYDPKTIDNSLIDYIYKAINTHKAQHPFLLINSICAPFKIQEKYIFKKSELKTIKSKTLIITGKYDKIIPYKDIIKKTKTINNIQVKIFEKSGHAPLLEENDKFNEIVLQFISGNSFLT